MTEFVFDIPAFRVSYPAFGNTTAYPDATLQAYWDTACCYIENYSEDCGWLSGDCRYKALTLMTAHLAAISTIVANGQVPGQVQSASIDKISVSLTAPPQKNQWQWWLNLTPYGQALLVLLQTRSVGGFVFGGSPERLAFRRFGGFFY